VSPLPVLTIGFTREAQDRHLLRISAARDGANEIDMVIDRGVFWQAIYDRVFDGIAATKECEIG
jgi:deoxyribose-phosphate aldolase